MSNSQRSVRPVAGEYREHRRQFLSGMVRNNGSEEIDSFGLDHNVWFKLGDDVFVLFRFCYDVTVHTCFLCKITFQLHSYWVVANLGYQAILSIVIFRRHLLKLLSVFRAMFFWLPRLGAHTESIHALQNFTLALDIFHKSWWFSMYWIHIEKNRNRLKRMSILFVINIKIFS